MGRRCRSPAVFWPSPLHLPTRNCLLVWEIKRPGRASLLEDVGQTSGSFHMSALRLPGQSQQAGPQPCSFAGPAFHQPCILRPGSGIPWYMKHISPTAVVHRQTAAGYGDCPVPGLGGVENRPEKETDTTPPAWSRKQCGLVQRVRCGM